MSRPVILYTGQWTDLSLEVVCELASGMGYDGLELAAWGHGINIERAAVDANYANTIVETTKRYGLKIYALAAHTYGQLTCGNIERRHEVHAPAILHGSKEAIRQWATDMMWFATRAAKNMGIKTMTGYMGAAVNNATIPFPEIGRESIADAYADTTARWSEIFDEMDACGVRFALELHASQLAYDYYTFIRLIQAFGLRKTLGISLDPSDLIWHGVQPDQLIKAIPDRIYHVQACDATLQADGLGSTIGSNLDHGSQNRAWDYAIVGKGRVDFMRIAAELNRCGYSGSLSVECKDKRIDRISAAKEAIRMTGMMNIMVYEGANKSYKNGRLKRRKRM